jgi:heat shock protein HslJ
MMNRLVTTSAVLLAVSLAACGGAAEPGSPTDEADAANASTAGPAGSWVLVDASPPIDVPEGARVTLQVTEDGDAWQAGGTSACNSYGGTVRTDGNGWLGQGYGQTGMACDEPRMAAEQAYLDALMAVDAWARPSDDELMLTGRDVELRFASLPPVPTEALTGTTWVLEGLRTGTDPDSAVATTAPNAAEATLVLTSDGTLTASTGCRTFDGEWVETGDELLFTTFGETADSPNIAADGTTTCDTAVVAQEDHVLSVLGDGFRAEIDGTQLTLHSRDGLGLTYRAAGTDR